MRSNKAETVRIAKDIMGTDEQTAGAIYDELMPMFSNTENSSRRRWRCSAARSSR